MSDTPFVPTADRPLRDGPDPKHSLAVIVVDAPPGREELRALLEQAAADAIEVLIAYRAGSPAADVLAGVGEVGEAVVVVEVDPGSDEAEMREAAMRTAQGDVVRFLAGAQLSGGEMGDV